MSNMYSPQNRVIVKEIEQENKTASGIIISPITSDVDNLAKLGVVVVDAVGVVNDEKTGFKEGQRVYFSKFSGVRFNKDGEKYTSLSFSEIIAIC
jgi:chaperonin GroES